MNPAKKTTTFIAIILPLLFYYDSYFLGISLTIVAQLVLVVLAGFVIFMRGRISLNIAKEHTIMNTWLIFITLLMFFFAPYHQVLSSEFVNNLLLLTLFFIGISLGLSGVFDLSFGVRAYRVIVIFSTIFLAIQIFSFYILKIPINGNLPFLQLNSIYFKAFTYLSTDAYQGGYVRFSSIFSEPSHFALYTMPYLCITLFGYKDIIHKNIFQSIILTAFIMLSTSANGIVAVSIVWSAYFLFISKKDIITRLMVPVAGLMIILVLFNILMNFTFFSETVGNLFVSSGAGQSKADYRIYRGFAYFIELPMMYNLLGVGYTSANLAADYYGIITKFDYPGAMYEYFNAIAQILIYSGIIGLLLYLNMIKTMLKRTDITGRILILLFAAFSISSSIFMNSYWQLYILLIYACYQDNKLDAKNCKVI